MESDIIARIDKELSDCEIAGWEDVPFPEGLLMECKEEIIAASLRWIPVEEELPEIDQNGARLATAEVGILPAATLMAWWQICDYEDGKWREQDERDAIPWRDALDAASARAGPTALKPLFEPPPK
jgi:hypothetical protein